MDYDKNFKRAAIMNTDLISPLHPADEDEFLNNPDFMINYDVLPSRFNNNFNSPSTNHYK